MPARALLVGILALALGCSAEPPGPVDSATEKAAEEQLQQEAAREGNARDAANPPHNPDDDN